MLTRLSVHQENVQVNFGNFDFENMNFGNSDFQKQKLWVTFTLGASSIINFTFGTQLSF